MKRFILHLGWLVLAVSSILPVARAQLVATPTFTSISVPSSATIGATINISATARAEYSDNSDGNDWNTPDDLRILRIKIDYKAPGGSWINLTDWLPQAVSPNTANTSLTLNQTGTWYVRFQCMDGRPWYEPDPGAYYGYAVTVNPPPSPSISSSLSVSLNQGAYVNYNITATNSPTSFSASNLPAGLSLDTTNGHIYGYYTGASSVNTTISASNAYGTGSATLSWSVTAASISGSPSSTPTLQVAGQSVTLAYSAYANFGIAWVERTVWRPNGTAYSPGNTTGTNNSFGWVPDGGAGTYTYVVRIVDNYYNYIDRSCTFTVQNAPTASIGFSPANPIFGQGLTYTATGADADSNLNEITIQNQAPGSGTWNAWADWTFSPTSSSTQTTTGTPSQAGTWNLRVISYDATGFNSGWQTQAMTVAKATPAIGNWPNRSLPWNYTVQSSDLAATFANPYNGGVTAPTLSGITYGFVGGGGVSAGTVLSPSATYTVRVNYPGDTNYNATSADVTWTTLPPPPAVTSPTGMTATVGSAANYQTTATNGPSAFGFTWYTAAPGAASFNSSNGLFTITPSGPPGAYSFGVGAQNASGWSPTQTVNLTVYGRQPTGSLTNNTASGTTLTFGQTISLRWAGSAPDNNLSYIMTRMGGPATVVTYTTTAPATSAAQDSGAWGTGFTWSIPGSGGSSMTQDIVWLPTAAGTFASWGHVRNSDWSGTMNDGRDYNITGPSFTVNKATPTVTFASRTISAPAGTTYAITASDLNAALVNPYSASVAQPNGGSVTYRFAGTSTAVTSGTVLQRGYTYSIEAVYPGDGNYNALTIAANFAVAGASAPTSFQPTTTGSTLVTFSWQASMSPVGINRYEIYRNGASVGTVSGSTLTFTDTTASASTAYTYTIQAVDNSGNVSTASTVSVTTQKPLEVFTPLP